MQPVTANRSQSLTAAMQRILDARHHDPFEVLGPRYGEEHDSLCVYLPDAGAARVSSVDSSRETTLEVSNMEFHLQQIDQSGFFVWQGAAGSLPKAYQLIWRDAHGQEHHQHDAYAFEPQIGDLDMHLFAEGRHHHAYRVFGARARKVAGVDGVMFATWAPNAERVSVVGDFNQWDGRRHAMRSRGASGVWELFIPGVSAGNHYKFELRNRDSGEILLKVDPYARSFETRPATACRVPEAEHYIWQDDDWMNRRHENDWLRNPISVYEVHLGSWQRDPHGGFLNYRELAEALVPYVRQLGFSHIELLPVTEHPLDASWGYQTVGYFAPTSRFGDADDFRYLVDHCHQHGIGVLMDWAPGHFPKDHHGLARFDGSCLYEHEDPRRGEHQDWGTLIFNYGRNEVRNLLLASAVYWMQEFHIDGLRVDAVASMLYLDYSREAGEWLPNEYGGRENLEAIDFLRQLNEVSHRMFPGVMIIAEESTDWPMVSRPTYLGGLGFSLKWNMGWMHDSLEYMQLDPVYRKFHHDKLSFGLLYAFTENFMLPFSHDEVVHGKGSMINKMPGDDWQRFANLRLLYTYMFTHPGKKLLFMGCEFAQGPEWNHDQALEWTLLEHAPHAGVQKLVSDLNRLYRDYPALHQHDFDAEGFEWIDCHDAAQSVVSYLRHGNGQSVIVLLNFTPVPRHDYRIGVPGAGEYREIFNSDSQHYGGSNLGNGGLIQSEAQSWMGRQASLVLTVPPLGGVVLIKD